MSRRKEGIRLWLRSSHVHLVWKKKKGRSLGAGPRRRRDGFGEGMMWGFSERFYFFVFKKKKRKEKTKQKPAQRGRPVSSESLRTHSWEGYFLAGYLLVIAHSAGRQHLRTESRGSNNVLIWEKSLFFERAKHTVRQVGKKSIWRSGCHLAHSKFKFLLWDLECL